MEAWHGFFAAVDRLLPHTGALSRGSKAPVEAFSMVFLRYDALSDQNSLHGSGGVRAAARPRGAAGLQVRA